MPAKNNKKLLYIWKGPYPWDIRIDKICTSLADNGFDVFVLARWNGENTKEDKYKNHNIIRAGFRQPSKLFIPVSFNPFWKKSIAEAIAEVKPDIIIVREIMLFEVSAKLAKKYKIPCIMDMAENYPAAMREWKKYNKSALSKFLVHNLKLPDKTEKSSVELADGIITVCSEQNERLHQEYNYPKEKLQVVHNTPNLDWLLHADEPFRNLPFVTFGHHGHLSAEKSIYNLIVAFSLVVKKNPNVRLLIAGAGESYNDYTNLARSLKIFDLINFTGQYQFYELPEIINNIDIGIMPYQESDFNNYTVHNKIFDYLSAGRPVIVSKAGPMMRIIEETGAGIIADCNNPENLAKAMTDMLQMDLNKMSESGINAFNYKYNWDMDSINLLSFIRSFL